MNVDESWKSWEEVKNPETGSTRPCLTGMSMDSTVFNKCCNCVLCIFFVFAHLTHGNVIFYILEQTSFEIYTTCWVFLAIRHLLYLCDCVFYICIFVFVCLTNGNINFDIPLNNPLFQKYTILVLSGTLSYTIIVYFEFEFLYLRV